MNQIRHIRRFIIILGIGLSACGPLVPTVEATIASTAVPLPQTTTREAQVLSVDVAVSGTNPPRVKAVVRGTLAESCATLAPSRVSYASNVFEIKVYAVSPTDRGCVQVTAPYETTVALDVSQLPAGSYTVVANGVSAVFALPSAERSPTAVPTAVPTSIGCVDSAAFVSDVTIPDNTELGPNAAFTKTWRLRNTGSCLWNSRYLVSYLSGTTMTQQPAYWFLRDDQTVAPGHTVDVSVGMTSPVQSGKYGSLWGLRNETGELMPIQGGAHGNSFYVKIVVNGAGEGAAGRITASSIDIQLEQGSGAACSADATYFVHAYITADGPTSASYEIDSSAGQIPAGNFQVGSSTALDPVEYGSVTFDQAGTQTVNLRFVGPYPYPDDITVMVRVNDGDWQSAKLSCPS